MAGEQFSLSWNEFHKNLSAGFTNLFEDSSLVDVTLAVEGRKIQAHKVVLSVCSPYFKELFHENPCQHPIVFLKDVQYTVLQNLLKFMYQGEVNVSQEELSDFIKTAEELQIKGLTGNGSTDTGQANNTRALKEEAPSTVSPSTRSGRIINKPKTLTSAAIPPRKSLPPPHHNATPAKKTKLHLVNSPPEIKRHCPDISNIELRRPEHIDLPAPPASANDLITNMKSEPVDYNSLDDDAEQNNVEKHEASFTPDDSYDNFMEPQAGTSMELDLEDGVSQELVKFTRSLRGHPQIIVANHLYRKEKHNHKKSSWRCVLYRERACVASCITSEKTLVVTGEHRHPPPFDMLAKRTIIEQLMLIRRNTSTRMMAKELNNTPTRKGT